MLITPSATSNKADLNEFSQPRRRSEVFDWILLSAIFLYQSFKVKSFLILHHRSYKIVLTHSYLNNSAFFSKTLYVAPPFHYPENRLAVTTLRTPDARSAQSKEASVRSRLYAPALRCRRMATTRLQPFGKGKKLFSARPSRSKDFISMWQSRGSAVANKGAFQQIATAPNLHVY